MGLPGQNFPRQEPADGGKRGAGVAERTSAPDVAPASPWARFRAAWPRMRPIPRGVRLVAAALLLVHALLIAGVGRAMGTAADESSYFNSGNIILRHGWKHNATVLQGPVPLYANQMLVPDFPSGGYDARKTPRAIVERGRLGTLPFALLSALVVFLWARRLFGEAGGLFALLLHALNPILLGYGSMLLVDAHHAAMVILTLFVLWCWLETRAPLLIPVLGLTLGFALATKYLTLFLALVVGTTVLVASARQARGAWQRARTATLTAGGMVLCALLTMHALYRFHEPFASYRPDERSSDLMRTVATTPVVGQLVQAFPAPFLRGLDFQLWQGERVWNNYMDGEIAHQHFDYFVWTVLYKTPEVVLVCAALVLVLRLPRLLRRDCPPAWRTAALVTFAYVLIAGGYLSFFTQMQLGIRYILPVYPILFLWLGALTSGLRPTGAPFVALFAAAGALLALDVRHNWPDLISYYNVSSGGQARAFLRFQGTNSDFGQYALTGVKLVRERYPGVQLLGRLSGPRLGIVATDCKSIRTGVLEWVTVHPVVHHLGASWWVFEVSAESFERALADEVSPDRRRDLCIALLGAGRRAEALPHLALLDERRAAPLHEILAALDAQERETNEENLVRLVRAWNEVGRWDRGAALYGAHPELLRNSRAAAVARARACEERHDYPGTIAVFDEFAFAPRDTFRKVLAEALTRNGQHAESRAVFQVWKENDKKRADTGHAKERAWRVERKRKFLELLR